MAGFWRDFRNGLRLMMREPLYACFALAELALGIGANVRRLLGRGRSEGNLRRASFGESPSASRSFCAPWQKIPTPGGRARPRQRRHRTNSFWRDELRSDPAIIGKSITLDGVPNEVIGVLPASFRFFKNDQLGARVQFGSQTEFFKPLDVDLSTVFPLGNFRSVRRLIVRDGMKPILLGMLVGIAASFVVGKAINNLFFGVRMGNPFLLALSAAIVLAVGLLACYVPVMATSRISPMQVLRSD